MIINSPKSTHKKRLFFQSLSFYKKRLSIEKYLRFLSISVAIIVATVVLYCFDPATAEIYPSSPFRALTGLFCPGCGTLRGLHQLLKGNFWTAFDFNPLAILSLPFLIYSYVRYAIKTLFGRSLPTFFIPSKWIWLLLKAIVVYWLLRNIPIAPFSFLAP
jgi:hypothetical protein